jgi:four helix bundle protein
MNFADLLEQKRKFVFANQILKSGTSIGADVSEAQNAESKADFIHKIKIAARKRMKYNIFKALQSIGKLSS